MNQSPFLSDSLSPTKSLLASSNFLKEFPKLAKSNLKCYVDA